MIEIKAHCKINLGLRVVRRREDGFHDIETVMLPVRGLYDTVFVEEMPSEATFRPLTPSPYPAARPYITPGSILEVSGLEVDCPPEQNICMKALRLVQHEYGTGEVLIRLEKAIPTGAGLGGGSADAAAVLRALDREFALESTDDELEALAGRLGSDVPFFVRTGGGRSKGSGAQLCTGRGEIMTPAEVDLTGYWLAIVKPPVAVSTAEAYAGVVPYEGGASVTEILRRPVGEWRGLLVNDFSKSVFARHPEIGAIERALYEAGAPYAAMSGSGSAVFGIFERRPDLRNGGGSSTIGNLFVHIERL